MIFFLSDFQDVTYARKLGSKDKKKRKSRISPFIIGELSLAGISALPYLGRQIGRKIGERKDNKAKLDLANQDINKGAEKVYKETFDRLSTNGVPVDESFNYAQKAANEYKKTMNASELAKTYVGVNSKATQYGNKGLKIGAGLSTLAIAGSVAYGIAKYKQRLAERNKLKQQRNNKRK